ncbi:hypothetical protein [Variovorax sp. JS1663]|uniref:hypothetical protein n=1 Tax=Variovorax sp. JS1663 TaxID=1851577 RepID=UPI00130275B9|nr:hypothetical protein [Variovorax sp. JS1663]
MLQSPEFQSGDAATRAGLAYKAGDVDAASKITTAAAAANKDTREAEKFQVETDSKKLAMAIDRFQATGGTLFQASQNPDMAPQLIQGLVDQKIMDPAYAQKVLQQASQHPNPAAFWGAGALATAKALDQTKQRLDQAEFAERQRSNRASEATAAGNLAVGQGNLAVNQGRLALEQNTPKGQVVETADGPMLVDQRTGAARPVTADGEPVGAKPSEAQKKELMSINQQRSIINGALEAVQNTPDAFTFKRGVAGKLPFGESIAGRMETDAQTQARSYVFNNVSRVINERAGAAQSAQELARLNGFLPADTDSPKQIQDKLKAFNHYLDDLEAGTKGAPRAAPGGSERAGAKQAQGGLDPSGLEAEMRRRGLLK